ncbi:MAG: hypothetical protein OXI96_11175 [Acidimicrobiaceae bacterium]|nr:hypothetical protein [Acidimicrobiaceae bacterium]
MLDRVKNLVFVLGLLVLPVYSRHSILDRFKNPVFALALSKRYRSKTYVIAVYVAYVVYAAYSLFTLTLNWDVVIAAYPYHGHRTLLEELFWASTLLVVVSVIFLVVPVLAASSVVGERRRGTLMLVQLSLLRPFDIVWGKVVASVAPVLFPAVVCVVTLLSFFLRADMVGIERVQWFFGSVIAGVALVVLSVAVSVVCVLFSTFAKSSAAAIVMSYGLLFSMIFMMMLAWD